MKNYLYLKTHNKTGLKYLGKTVKNPHSYLGSGKHWRRHLAKHGNDITTEILLETEDQIELSNAGLYYSNLWNIVEDKGFANMRPESGDGGNTSNCEAYKVGIKTRNLSGEHNPMYGRSAIKEQNIRWYNNGKDNIYVPEGTEPKGYKPGRIIDYKKPHKAETKKKYRESRGKRCVSPKGEIFRSAAAAGRQYKITGSAIRGLITRGVSGWHWCD